MIRHDPVLPPEFIYPIDDWRWVECRWTPEFTSASETTFSANETAEALVEGSLRRLEEMRPVAMPLLDPDPVERTRVASAAVFSAHALPVRRNLRGSTIACYPGYEKADGWDPTECRGVRNGHRA